VIGNFNNFPKWDFRVAIPFWELTLNIRIISKKSLIDYWTKIPATKSELEAWHAETKSAVWARPADVKAKAARASIPIVALRYL